MRLAAAVSTALLAAAPALASDLGPGPDGDRGPDLVGNGKKVTVQREVGSAFDAVELRGPVDAAIRVGPARSVAVTIDENLAAHVVTRVEGRRLVVAADRPIRWTGVGRVDVTVPALSAVSSSGSGDAEVEGASGDLALATRGSGDLRWRGEARKLEVALTGSGDVSLAGKAAALGVSSSGTGDLAARDLAARDATVQASGTGDVALTLAGGALVVAASGSGDVTWGGEASSVQTAASGSGDVARR